MELCCACQEGEATIFRLCGHKFCDACDQLIDENCRLEFCDKLAKLNAKGFPRLDDAILEKEANYSKLVRLEYEAIRELESLAKEQEKDLNEFAKSQARIMKRRRKEIDQRLEEAGLELKISEFRAEFAADTKLRLVLDPGSIGTKNTPSNYHKASQLPLVSGEGRTWNLYERGLFEVNEVAGNREVYFRFGLCHKIHDKVMCFETGFSCRRYSIRPVKEQPPHDQWLAPVGGYIIGISNKRILITTSLLNNKGMQILINESKDTVVCTTLAAIAIAWPSKIEELPWGLKRVDRYKFDGTSCLFPDGVRVFFDDPSIQPIPDPVKSAPKTMFHEICVQTPSGICYLQVPRAL